MKKIDRKIIQELYRPIVPTAHKGTLGHALIIGGSYGKMGAVVLSAQAALHTGCGLVTVFLPECGYTIIQTAFPEAMVLTDVNSKYLSNIEFTISPQAIGIGPGMGQEPATQKALHKFLKKVASSTVFDADALNILSANRTWLELLPKGSVLTPHPKEFERLVGIWISEAERVEMAQEFSIKHDVVLVLKGAPTLIVYHNEIYENTTGNAALATAGSGDVLTGMITSLMAQGYPPLEASILAVFLHGLTADIALAHTGTQAFIASDIIATIGQAYLTLEPN